MMADSIMQASKHCYVTGSTTNLDKHHIYKGNPLRRISEENGFWVWLRHDVHMALHARQRPFQNLDDVLKRKCQEEFERQGGTREEFMRLIRRNYLD